MFRAGLTCRTALVWAALAAIPFGCDDDGSGSPTTPANVAGTWDVQFYDGGGTLQGTGRIIVVQSGSVIQVIYGLDGTGTVSGDSFTITSSDASATIEATLTSPKSFSGNITYQGQTGTITGTLYSTSTEIPVFDVPVAGITVDGAVSDWSAVEVCVQDDNAAQDDISTPGSDIEYVKLAINSSQTRLYVLVKVSGTVSTGIWYRMFFDTDIDTDYSSNYDLKQTDFHYSGSTWDVVSQGWYDYGDDNWYPIDEGGDVAVSGAYIEGSVDIDLLGLSSQVLFFGNSRVMMTPLDRFERYGIVGIR